MLLNFLRFLELTRLDQTSRFLIDRFSFIFFTVSFRERRVCAGSARRLQAQKMTLMSCDITYVFSFMVRNAFYIFIFLFHFFFGRAKLFQDWVSPTGSVAHTSSTGTRSRLQRSRLHMDCMLLVLWLAGVKQFVAVRGGSRRAPPGNGARATGTRHQ